MNPYGIKWRLTVLVILLDSEGRVLVGLRGPFARVGANQWSCPGGGLEPEDTTVIDAAKRELMEETGLTMSDAKVVGWSQGHTGAEGRPYLSMHVVGRCMNPNALENRDNDTFERWEWRAADYLPSPLWSADAVLDVMGGTR